MEDGAFTIAALYLVLLLFMSFIDCFIFLLRRYRIKTSCFLFSQNALSSAYRSDVRKFTIVLTIIRYRVSNGRHWWTVRLYWLVTQESWRKLRSWSRLGLKYPSMRRLTWSGLTTARSSGHVEDTYRYRSVLMLLILLTCLLTYLLDCLLWSKYIV